MISLSLFTMKKITCGISGLLLIWMSICGYGQNGDLGSWNILNGKFAYNTKWVLFGEGQIRSLKYYNHFHYYEIKGGLEYKLTSNVRIALAAGKYDTYKEGGNFVLPKNSDEVRLWPQVIITHPMNRIMLEHRYRAEMRFTTLGYRNRFRYRFGIYYDIRKAESLKKPIQVYINNELFFTNQPTYFERNRFSVGFQYEITPKMTLLLAYLHQFDYNLLDETGRDFFQIGCSFDLKAKSGK
jgi:hypothetical protein